MDEQLDQLARLLQQRNALDGDIASILGRPMTSGHAGEWIASQVFDIELEASASAAAIDGRFRSGPLAGRNVNVKWYLLREGMLDMTEYDVLDYYLVLTGPPAHAAGRADAPATTAQVFAERSCVEQVDVRDHPGS